MKVQFSQWFSHWSSSEREPRENLQNPISEKSLTGMSERNVWEHKAYCNANAKSNRESLKISHFLYNPRLKRCSVYAETMPWMLCCNKAPCFPLKRQYDAPLPTVFPVTDSTSSLFTGQATFTGLPVLISPSYNYFDRRVRGLYHTNACAYKRA